MSHIDEKIIEELRAKHGELFRLTASGETLLLKRPTRGAYQQFRTYAADERKRPIAAETLAAHCVVFPDKQVWSALLDSKPGLSDVVAAKLAEIAGIDETAELEKL